MYNKIINKYISAKASGKSGDIYVYGEITDYKIFNEDVVPSEIRDTIKEMGDIDTLNLHFNSGGGSVFAGAAIIAIINGYKKNGLKVNSYIEGLCASMATQICMVADKIYMNDNTMFMIHNSSMMTWGNANDLEKGAELLRKVDENMIATYMARFKGTEDELKQLLADETWMTANEANKYGFVDEVVASTAKAAASVNGIKMNGVEFNKDILQKIKDKIKVESEDEVKDVLIYDAKLAEYGISEEDFKALASVNDLVTKIVTKSREGLVAEKDVTDAKAALETKTAEYTKLADKFEAVRQEKIEDAIQNGIRANAVFNEAKWRERLKDKDYDEIMDLSNEWAQNAKDELHAGKRFTNSPTTTQNTPERKENLNF
jgi:ATP-dependent Clp protease, protease subunit